MFDNADIIASYTNEMGIEDGLFIALDATELAPLAREAGFKIPLIVTSTVYETVFKPSPAAARRGESFTGRAWDVFMVLRYAAANSRNTSTMNFAVKHTNAKGRSVDARLYAVIDHMGDGSPCIKVMFPDER